MATNSNTVGPPANIPGLPALPKSLSGLLNVSSGTWRETGRIHAMKTMIQDDYSRSNGRGRDPKDKKKALKPPPGNLDAALAILRKEMVGLRQLDMSLLCQLWSLNESIQDYKSMCLDSTLVSECGSCESGHEETCPHHGLVNGHHTDYSDLDSELASPPETSKSDW